MEYRQSFAFIGSNWNPQSAIEKIAPDITNKCEVVFLNNPQTETNAPKELEPIKEIMTIKIISGHVPSGKNVAEIYLNSVKKNKLGYKVFLNINSIKKYFYINSNFESDIQNLLAAVLIISIFRDVKKLNKNTFRDHITPEGRGDISKIKMFNKSFYLVDESYNSNPLSLKQALKNFDMLRIDNSKKHLILGDMLELGKHSKKLHIQISKSINKLSINNVNVIGKYMINTYNNLHECKKGSLLKNKKQIINLIKNNINNNDYLMIKGSNSTGLNKLTNNIKAGEINAL